MDTSGYLYNHSFVPTAPSQNLLASNNDDGGNQQFRLYYFLDTAKTYFLVVTTNTLATTGPFSISATGLGSATFIANDTSGKNSISFRVTMQPRKIVIRRWMCENMESRIHGSL